MAKKKKSDVSSLEKKNEKNKFEKFPTMLLVGEEEIAMDFASKIYKNFELMISSIIMFGSSANQEKKIESDIDIAIILDDISVRWDEELIAIYRKELGRMVSENPYIKSLHLNTIKLSVWWQDLLRGDPVVIDVLRQGKILIDKNNFFLPQKALLQSGNIRPSAEAIYNLLERTTVHLGRSRVAVIGAVESCYWACVDSAHALLMSSNNLPPSPRHVAEMLEKIFVKDLKMMDNKYVKIYTDTYDFMKKIEHGDLKSVSGKELDRIRKDSEEFVLETTRIIDKLIETKE